MPLTEENRRFGRLLRKYGFYRSDASDATRDWLTHLAVEGKMGQVMFSIELSVSRNTEAKWLSVAVRPVGGRWPFHIYSEESESFERDLGDEGYVWDCINNFCRAFGLATRGRWLCSRDGKRSREFCLAPAPWRTAQTGGRVDKPDLPAV